MGRNTLEKLVRALRDNRAFLIFMFVFFSMRWSLADHYRVPTGSMLPTVQIGDHLLVNKMAYDLKLPFTDFVLVETGPPKRGQIIVFESPEDPSINFVKRLIAIPGDRVEILDGFVKINGAITLRRPDSFRAENQKLHMTSQEFQYQEVVGGKEFSVQRIPVYSRHHTLSFVVPENRYFFMGDNRDNSSDSRSWGFVPRDHLKGQVTNVTMSITFDRLIPRLNLNRFGKELI